MKKADKARGYNHSTQDCYKSFDLELQGQRRSVTLSLAERAALRSISQEAHLLVAPYGAAGYDAAGLVCWCDTSEEDQDAVEPVTNQTALRQGRFYLAETVAGFKVQEGGTEQRVAATNLAELLIELGGRATVEAATWSLVHDFEVVEYISERSERRWRQIGVSNTVECQQDQVAEKMLYRVADGWQVAAAYFMRGSTRAVEQALSVPRVTGTAKV